MPQKIKADPLDQVRDQGRASPYRHPRDSQALQIWCSHLRPDLPPQRGVVPQPLIELECADDERLCRITTILHS